MAVVRSVSSFIVSGHLLNDHSQRQIVTCSGGRNTGSVNVVRNGADFQELAFVHGLTNIANVWAVRAQFDDT